MSLSLFIGSLLQATSPQVTQGMAALPSDAIFLHGQARYFNAIVTLRDCSKRLPKQTKALKARYEADRRKLAERFGARYFDMQAVTPQTVDTAQKCDAGTLAGFEDKLVAIEQLLDGSE